MATCCHVVDSTKWMHERKQSTSAESTANSTASQCARIKTCYEGGVSTVPCSVATGECPPCVTFTDDACYVKVDGSCAFGVDCSNVFSIISSTSSSNSAASSTTDTSVPSTTTEPTSVSASRTGDGVAGGSSSETDSGSDDSNTVLIVAILAVALGVALLAVILRKLFLRARAGSEENQEEVPSPPATVTTASFSSNGTSRDPGIMISRSAMGTDLSVASKSSGV
ncbi:hypothetical protein AM587_10013487 [Phytophthora nicotianae]|uniref:Uncharacterized protein n=1 Tax=Phytophthora nicotianae TaxID=4792 RepID=A0A0W8CIX7_PHYNI|nr:hypothetical protein AM587_10013487 [Phytophthora nicotianae]